ncbi:MAG: hypothetical protein ACT4NU_03980 [Chromatiales bacterium]
MNFRSELDRTAAPLRAPSWRLLLPALQFPARGYALPIVIVFALLFWLGSASITGLVAFALAVSWPMKYAYHVLGRTALGHMEPPPMTIELVNPLSQQPLKHLGVLFAMLSVCYWAGQLGGTALALPLLVAALYFQPACAAVIALDDSLAAALDPRTLMAMVRVLGQDYLAVTAVLIVVGVAAFLFAGRVPSFLWYGLLLWGTLSSFHLLGLAIYRHRDELGVEADVSPERERDTASAQRRKELNALLDEVYKLSTGDRTQRAIDRLLDGLKSLGDTVEDNAYVHQQALSWSSPVIALRHGQHYVSLLLRAGRLEEALVAYERCLARSDRFRVERADQVLRLAQHAAGVQRKPVLALHVLKDFEQRFPDHPDAGAVARLRTELLTPNATTPSHRF